MVGAAVAVLVHRAPELRHRQDDGVLHAVAEVGDQRGDRAREIVEAVGELTLRGALVHVRVPAADVGERDLEADVRLGQLRDLPQRLAERAARIVGAVARADTWTGRLLLSILMASNASRPVPFSTWSAAAAYTRFERRAGAVAALAAANRRTARSGSSPAAGAVPCSMRGSCGVSATARNGVASSRLLAPAGTGSASRRPCSSRPASPSPCSPARRSATACCPAIRRRARSPAGGGPRAASAAAGAG